MRPLAVIGNVNVDLIMGPAEPWPQPGTEIIVEHDELRVGGAAGNAALAWQALGVDYQIAANVGSDRFGEWLQDSFPGRSKHWPVVPSATTLSVGITHPNGERTFFTTRGHLASLTWAQVSDMLDVGRLKGGVVLLCGSFLMGRLMQASDAIFDWAETHDIAIALDTGWPLDGWTEANKQAAQHWVSRSRCLLLNEVEAGNLSGAADPQEAGRRLLALMPAGATVVIKCGPDGAIAIGPDGEVAIVDAPKVAVIDTIGAGDVFNAAFLAALAGGQPLKTCLTAGTDVASRAVSTSPRQYAGHDLFPALEARR